MHGRRLLIASTLLLAACGASPSSPPAITSSSPSTLTGPPSTPSAAVVLSPPVTQSPVAASASLTLTASGLGPCHQPWYSPCEYGIRVEGAGGYDHRGTYAWDSGLPPSGGMGQGTAGPVSSTGVTGDLPATLGPGLWTLSFRLSHGSDVASYNPVPGGTPRLAEEDPFTAACFTTLDTAGVVSVTIHVTFKGSACRVVTKSVPG